MYKQLIICINLVLISITAFGQENYRAGTLTQLNLNFKPAKNLKLNTKIESRQLFSQKETGATAHHKFQYDRADLTFLLTTKVSADNTLGGGYMVRLEDDKYLHRLVQQFNNVRNFERLSLAHRIVLDETFSKDEPFGLRANYRIGIQKPLKGQHIDPKELYAKIHNDYLATWSDRKSDFEIGGVFALGYNTTNQDKIELGLEYRTDAFNRAVKEQQLWLTLAWFVSL